MVEQVKVLVTTLRNLSSVSRTHKVEGQTYHAVKTPIVLVRFSITVIKHHDEKQLEERICIS